MLLLMLERVLEAMTKIESRRTSRVFHLPRSNVDIQREGSRGQVRNLFTKLYFAKPRYFQTKESALS